jgi:GDPmannose 4,6-dehydratase
MRPQSPYGVAKLYAYWIVNNYRDIYNGFFVNGILFNHESERRPENFVTRKITSYVAHYANVKVVEPLRLGNLYSKRDWGYAKDYVSAMYMMLEQDHPEDFVVSTGECHTVKDFVNEAFKCIGVNVEWSGSGLSEVGIDSKTSKPIIVIDSNYFRPTEVDYLLGDATKAKEKLGWKPETTFRELVSIMVSHDQDNISKNSHGTSS